MIKLDNVIGAELDTGSGATAPYSAPSAQQASDQAAAISSLQASILTLANKIRTITASTTATLTDKTILVNATSAAIVVGLPLAASTVGQIVTIKKIDASANTVTIDADTSELIDGALTQVITMQWMSLTLQSNGTAWFVL